MRRNLQVVGMLVVLGACAGGEAPSGGEGGAASAAAVADPAAARAAIDAANAKAVAGFNTGVLDSMLSNYADDAIVMMPGMKAMRGKAAIDSGFKGFLSQMDMKNFNQRTEDVMLGGDVAVETGAVVYDVGPRGGKLATDTAKYITVWKRQGDGSWKIVRDINNSDIPPKM